MECLLLSLFAMLFSVVFLLCTKAIYKFKIFIILSLISIGTFLIPTLAPLKTGKWFNLPTNYSVLSQQLSIVFDPFSAFIGLLLVFSFVFYLYKLSVNETCRKKFHMPEAVMLMLFSVVLSISVQNVLYYVVAFWILTSVLVVLSNKLSSNLFEINTKFILVSIFSFLSILAIILLGINSHSFSFDRFVEILKNNIDLSNNVFCLLFAGFGIPFLLSDRIIVNPKLEKANERSELFMLKMMLSFFYLYCLLRFTIMGAVPFPLCHLFILVGLAGYAVVKLYKLIKVNNITCILYNMQSIQNILVIVSVLTGVSGYICNNPLVSILGFSSAFIFFINKIISSFASELTENEQRNFHISILSYAGLPLTIGFWGACFLMCSACVGIISPNIFLKLCSYILAITFSIIVLVQLYKVFILLKEYINNENKSQLCNFRNSDLLFYGLIILMGIFPQKVLKLVFIPVSMFVGGTNFYDTFKAIGDLVSYINIYILGFVGLTIIYIVLKYLILIIKKHNSNG